MSNTKKNSIKRPRTGDKKKHKAIDTEKTKKNSVTSSKHNLFDDDEDTSQNKNSIGKLIEQKKNGDRKKDVMNSQDKMVNRESDEEEPYGEQDHTNGGLEESNQNINPDENDDDEHIIQREQ